MVSEDFASHQAVSFISLALEEAPRFEAWGPPEARGPLGQRRLKSLSRDKARDNHAGAAENAPEVC